jgi:hypothetical protein
MAQSMASAWPPDAPNPNPSSIEDIEGTKPVDNSVDDLALEDFRDIDFGDEEDSRDIPTEQAQS